MSYDLMVFHPVKGSCELVRMREWFQACMENDVLPGQPPDIFRTFLESIQKVFPSMEQCPEDRLEYACDYEIHDDFIYMCFGYSAAKEAHGIVKRQAKADNLGFWDVSQSFDPTFPITLPTDRWPMLMEAQWIKYGKTLVYDEEGIRKILVQMKTPERSSVCLTDRFGNYIQAGGYQDAFIVEVRRYIDAVAYRQTRADLKQESSEPDAFVTINGWQMKVPKSQILSKAQMCALFRKFTGGVNHMGAEHTASDDEDIFWREIKV